MKKFLLMAGVAYYPEQGTGDWIDTYETYEEARSHVTTSGESYYLIGCKRYKEDVLLDWYEIVDLEEWMNSDDK